MGNTGFMLLKRKEKAIGYPQEQKQNLGYRLLFVERYLLFKALLHCIIIKLITTGIFVVESVLCGCVMF